MSIEQIRERYETNFMKQYLEWTYEVMNTTFVSYMFILTPHLNSVCASKYFTIEKAQFS